MSVCSRRPGAGWAGPRRAAVRGRPGPSSVTRPSAAWTAGLTFYLTQRRRFAGMTVSPEVSRMWTPPRSRAPAFTPQLVLCPAAFPRLEIDEQTGSSCGGPLWDRMPPHQGHISKCVKSVAFADVFCLPCWARGPKRGDASLSLTR